MAKFSFCRGIILDANFCDTTCRLRESCAYYDVDFYRKHAGHLEDFTELYPIVGCDWFIPNGKEQVETEKVLVDPFGDDVEFASNR